MAKVTVLAALLAAPLVAAQNSSAVMGTDILNFALNLECLEAEFYSWAAYGKGLNATMRGGGPETDGPTGLPDGGMAFAGDDADIGGIAKEIADDEIAHVAFLRAALGDAAVPCPLMDITTAFDLAFQLAANVSEATSFDPYASPLYFLHGAFIFEDVGVTAYNGAVPAATKLLSPGVVQAAASILAVEAYHAGIVRDRLVDKRTAVPPTGLNLTVEMIVAAISNLRDSVDGPSDDDQSITIGDAINLVPTNSNGLVYARSPGDVLSIVYLGGKTSGGFFPAGINGKFANMTSAELTAALNAVMEGSPDSDSDKAGTDDNGAFGGSNFVFASIAAAVLALFAAF